MARLIAIPARSDVTYLNNYKQLRFIVLLARHYRGYKCVNWQDSLTVVYHETVS